MAEHPTILGTVGEVMSDRVITVTHEMKIQDIVLLMRVKDVGAVVVTKDNEHIGILTESDALRLVTDQIKLDSPIYTIMSVPLISCPPSTPLSSAFLTMRKRKIKHLPVVENKRLVGMFTARDVISRILLSPKHSEVKYYQRI
jgi:signal-transduction protein with cAMP-binding, CBS, and nucleotidyltransferase domain